MPELEEFWDEVRVRSPIRMVTDKPSDLDSQLTLACEKAVFDLKTEFQEYNGLPVTSDMLAQMVAKGVRCFMQHWKNGLRGQDLAGLIEIVLEGQQLGPEEMTQFVRALPESLLKRICQSAVGTTTGVHGVIAVEWYRRQGKVQDVRIEADGARVKCTFTEPSGRISHFFLDDPFEIEAE